MSKVYFFKFGTGNPALNTGISPTLIFFYDQNGATLTAPAITEALAGSGIYKFTYTPTLGIAFVADGGTSSILNSDRYVTAALDPIQTIDQVIGSSLDSFGAPGIDPTTLFGFMKRNLEFSEGNATYTKLTNSWQIYTRGTSLLITKTLTDTQTTTTKT